MWHKLALLACLGLCASAQDAISNATSGPWTAELNGIWRWHDGDDLRWAAASFDDSQWARLTLPGTPPNALRYWIRIPVLLGRASDPSVLVGPIAYAYEAYWDGQRIGSLGKGPPTRFAVRSLVFHIPVRFAEAGL